MAKQNPNRKKPTVKSKEVLIIHSVFNHETQRVVPAGSVVKAAEVKAIPDQYKATQ